MNISSDLIESMTPDVRRQIHPTKVSVAPPTHTLVSIDDRLMDLRTRECFNGCVTLARSRNGRAREITYADDYIE
jgi:hypothetical protein